MSKIAEQKALEAYQYGCHTFVESKREGYIKGYDQAMQDVLDKAEKILTERMYFSDDEAKQFKNYMKDEM